MPDQPASFVEFLPQLIEARERQGRTRRDVGVALGLSQATIDSWERHHRTPTAVNARRWADHLGVQLPADTGGWFAKQDRVKQPRHGTRSGYQWHLRTGNIPPCQECRSASAAYAATRRRRNSPGR